MRKKNKSWYRKRESGKDRKEEQREDNGIQTGSLNELWKEGDEEDEGMM